MSRRSRPAPSERPYVAALVAADLDTDPHRDPALPARTYLVCSTPRSGSTLLCSALQATGVAGTPTEYFNVDFRGPLAARWGVRGDLAAYVRELLARRSSPAGVFGAKLHWSHLDELRREIRRTKGRAVAPADAVGLLAELFPGATYVHVRRRETDRQAISYWKAAYTGVWHEGSGERVGRQAAAPYNFRAIRRLEAEILRADASWREAFARAGVSAIDVVYEDLVAAYETTVASLAGQVAGVAIPSADVAAPALRPQTDGSTEVFLERFRRDTAAARRPVLADARDLALDVWVRARTFPFGAVARERLSEIGRSGPSR